MALRSRPTPDAARGGFAVLDVETTGLSPRTDRIVELAIVRLDPAGAVVAQHASLVNPDRDVSPTRIHGITASDVAGAPRFAELAGWLAAELAGCVLVGHNVAFDLRFAQAEFARLGIGLPALPALCTMRLAPDYLPSLPGRSLAACCAVAGIPLTTAHSALGDAQATARLFAAYRRHHRALPGPWAAGLREASRLRWPGILSSPLRLVTREVAAEQRAAEVGYLARLVSQLPRTGTHNAELESYLAVLDRALEDRRIDPAEARALHDAAVALGIGPDDVLNAHQDYLHALARAAWADGAITRAERTDLDQVARLLGLPSGQVDHALTTARATPTRQSLVVSNALRAGMSVCFTGATDLDRAELTLRATAAGLRVVSSVSRKTDVLVVADPASASTKARRARELGTRIVTEAVFLTMLGSCQPEAAGTSPVRRDGAQTAGGDVRG